MIHVLIFLKKNLLFYYFHTTGDSLYHFTQDKTYHTQTGKIKEISGPYKQKRVLVRDTQFSRVLKISDIQMDHPRSLLFLGKQSKQLLLIEPGQKTQQHFYLTGEKDAISLKVADETIDFDVPDLEQLQKKDQRHVVTVNNETISMKLFVSALSLTDQIDVCYQK